jgi:hypothetical protein
MSIERFTKDEFESALPVDKKDYRCLWREAGLESGEYTYRLPVKAGVVILIRSSVRADGIAAESGKDSIRCWLARDDGSPMGSKIQAYVTRVSGWQDRMTGVLKELWVRALTAGTCPHCGLPLSIFKVKKDGKNKGRLFVKCWDCKDHETFRWLDEPEIPENHGKPRYEEMEIGEEDVILDSLREHPTKKAKLAWLRELLSEDRGCMLWSLIRVYDWQTEDEKNSEMTSHLNKIGFSGVDAEILTSYSKQFLNRKSLSPKQLELAHKKMPKYAAQLIKQLV